MSTEWEPSPYTLLGAGIMHTVFAPPDPQIRFNLVKTGFQNNSITGAPSRFKWVVGKRTPGVALQVMKLEMHDS